MSDRRESLPAWVVDEFRRPVRGSAAARDRVMDLVRHAPMPLRRASLALQFRRGGVLRTSVGLAAAASIAGLLTTAGLATRSLGDVWGQAPRVARGAAVVMLGDSIANQLRDTLTMVRFVLEAPSASRVAVAGDFTAWRPTTTLVRADGEGRWTAVVALPRGRHAYTFVVDDSQRVPGPDAQGERVSLVSSIGHAPGDSL